MTDHPSGETNTELLWVDIETTGLDPFRYRPLEIGLIRTTAELEIIDGVFACIGPPPTHAELESLDPTVVQMHHNSGLWEELCDEDALNSTEEVDFEIAWWITERFGKNAVLAGSSVHFDLSWLRVHFPNIAKLVSHKTADVTAMHEFLRRWMPGITEVATEATKPTFTHRVQQDLIDSIALAAFYRSVILSRE